MKALITELIWDEGIEELKSQGFEVDYDETLWADRERLLEILPRYEAVIVRNQTKVDSKFLDTGSKLRAVGRLGVGLDNIDVQYAKDKNIKVVFARHANATSVAEYVMAAILGSSRTLHLADTDVRNGSWNRKKYTGGEVYQKTLGLIGLGEISHRVARRANAFGMKLVGYDPFITEYDHIISETGVTVKSTLHQLLEEADYVSLHVPLTSSTQHLLSSPQLSIMKSSAYVINTSRGGIIDEVALSEALQKGEIAGAYLDVLEQEPVREDHPLLQCGNATLTPHIAGLTEESQVRTSFLVAKEIGKVLKGEGSLCTV
jgi:D-3-phosphoglycerate dehydrogenase